MNLTHCPYVPGQTLMKDDVMAVYQATHHLLGKEATLWMYEFPADWMGKVDEIFHRQMALAGNSYHPNVASIFMAGIEGQSAYYVQEPQLRTSLADVTAQTPPRSREDFYQMFLPLVEMLRMLSRLALSWERVRLTDIMVTAPGRYRIQRWNPFYHLDRAGLKGPLPEQFARLPGLYYTEDVFDFDRNARTLAQWMYESVSPGGRSHDTAIRNYQLVLSEKRKKGAPVPRMLEGLDPFIERFVFRLSQAKLQGGYDSLDDVIVALERVRRGDTMEELPGGASPSGSPSPAVSRLHSDVAAEHHPVPSTSFTTMDYTAVASPKAAPGSKRKRMMIVLVVSAVIALAALGAWLVMSNANSPPTAQIVLLQTQARVHEKVMFDGSRSSDPDGDLLHYHWNIVEPRDVGTNYFIARNRTPSAATTTIQFFRPGTYRISLYVSDITHASELDYATITITE